MACISVNPQHNPVQNYQGVSSDGSRFFLIRLCSFTSGIKMLDMYSKKIAEFIHPDSDLAAQNLSGIPSRINFWYGSFIWINDSGGE